MKKEKIKGYISVTEDMKNKHFKEAFQGEVIDIPIRFPKDLGAEHPFKFEQVEQVFKKVGIINGIINKLVDNIVGEFSINVDNPNSKKIIDDFIKNTEFPVVIREWIREALVKGNGFIEIDMEEAKIRVLNANNMYVKRDTKGNVKGYSQYLGNITTFNPASRKLTPFEPNQIAHLKINKISGEAYALGLIWPNERTITNIVENEQDLHKLIKRKAGAPIHAKMGQPGQAVQPEDIDAMAEKLKFMNNRTEWPTDGNVEFKVIDFGNIGQNLTSTLEYDFKQLIAGMQIPEVLLGSGQLNEGIAKVQLEGLQRTVAAYQDEIEGILEEKVFKPLLEANKLSESIEFVWNLPSETEINNRLIQLNALLQNFAISENMKRMIQLEIAHLLHIEDADDYLLEPEIGKDEEESDLKTEMKKTSLDGAKASANAKKESPEAKKESKIPQPEVPGAKPNAREEAEIHIHEIDPMVLSGDITVKEFVNLQEIKGFNYSDYLVRILRRLKIDPFENLAAINEADEKIGLLNANDISKLRIILKDGFRRNKTVRQIEGDIRGNINLKDRFDETGKLQISAAERPNIITRTETVRIANEGLLDNFKDNGVKQVRYLAALSDRTCPICEGKNGEVHELNESRGIIPIHPNCRCSWISL